MDSIWHLLYNGGATDDAASLQETSVSTFDTGASYLHDDGDGDGDGDDADADASTVNTDAVERAAASDVTENSCFPVLFPSTPERVRRTVTADEGDESDDGGSPLGSPLSPDGSGGSRSPRSRGGFRGGGGRSLKKKKRKKKGSQQRDSDDEEDDGGLLHRHHRRSPSSAWAEESPLDFKKLHGDFIQCLIRENEQPPGSGRANGIPPVDEDEEEGEADNGVEVSPTSLTASIVDDAPSTAGKGASKEVRGDAALDAGVGRVASTSPSTSASSSSSSSASSPRTRPLHEQDKNSGAAGGGEAGSSTTRKSPLTSSTGRGVTLHKHYRRHVVRLRNAASKANTAAGGGSKATRDRRRRKESIGGKENNDNKETRGSGGDSTQKDNQTPAKELLPSDSVAKNQQGNENLGPRGESENKPSNSEGGTSGGAIVSDDEQLPRSQIPRRVSAPSLLLSAQTSSSTAASMGTTKHSAAAAAALVSKRREGNKSKPLPSSSYERPEDYLSPQVRLYKDRRNDSSPSAGSGSWYHFDPQRVDASEASLSRGKEAALEKLRQKTQLLGGGGSTSGGGGDDISTVGAALPLRRSNSSSVFARSASGPTITHDVHKIKVFPRGGGKDGSESFETRSLLKFKAGFFSVAYGILLQWDARGRRIVVIVLKKMATDSFLKDTPSSRRRGRASPRGHASLRKKAPKPDTLFEGVDSLFRLTLGSCDYGCGGMYPGDSDDEGTSSATKRLQRSSPLRLVPSIALSEAPVLSESPSSCSASGELLEAASKKHKSKEGASRNRVLTLDSVELNPAGSCTVMSSPSSASSTNKDADVTTLAPPYLIPLPDAISLAEPPLLQVKILRAVIHYRKNPRQKDSVSGQNPTMLPEANIEVAPYVKLTVGPSHHMTGIVRPSSSGSHQKHGERKRIPQFRGGGRSIQVEWTGGDGNFASFPVPPGEGRSTSGGVGQVVQIEVLDALRKMHLHGGILGRHDLPIRDFESGLSREFTELTVMVPSAQSNNNCAGVSLTLEVLHQNHLKWWANDEIEARSKSAECASSQEHVEKDKEEEETLSIGTSDTGVLIRRDESSYYNCSYYTCLACFGFYD